MSDCYPQPLLVNLAREFGGAEVRVLDLARACQLNESTIVCLEGSPLEQKARDAGLRYTSISARKSDPRIPTRLANLVRQGRFKIVDVHNVQSLFWTYPLLRLGSLQTAFVATIHSSTRMEQKNRLKGALYHTITRTALPHYDQIITVSQFLCEELQRDGISSDRIQRVPNGVQLAHVNLGQRADVRAEFGIPFDAPLIGAVGRLEPAKGLDVLIHAVGILRVVFPKIKCLIVGSGSQYNRLNELTNTLGLQEHIIFAGFRNDVSRLLVALDLYILPSRTEGIPFSLLEAAAAGLACVASLVGGVPEILQNEHSGLLIEPDNPAMLAQAVTQLLHEPALAQRLGQSALHDIPARFTMENMMRGTLQAYYAAITVREGRRR